MDKQTCYLVQTTWQAYIQASDTTDAINKAKELIADDIGNLLWTTRPQDIYIEEE